MGQPSFIKNIDIKQTGKIDSLIETINQDPFLAYEAYKYVRGKARAIDHEVLLYYSNKTVQAAQQLDSAEILAHVFVQHSIIHTNVNNLDSALIYIFKAESIIQNLNNAFFDARIFEATAFYHSTVGDFGLAMGHFAKADSIYHSIMDTTFRMTNLKKKAAYLRNIGKLEDSYKVYKAIFDIEEESRRIDDYRNLITISYELNDTVRLNKLYKEYQIYKPVSNPVGYFENRVKAFKASIDGDNELELLHLKKANSYALSTNRKKTIINSFIYLGNFYIRKKDYINAKSYYLRAYNALNQNGFSNYIDKVFNRLIECCEKLSHYKEALHYKKEQSEYTDFINKRINLARILGNKHEMNLAKKEYEIRELRVAAASQSKNFKLLGALSTCGLGLLLLVFYLFRRNKLISNNLTIKNAALDQSLLEQQTMVQETHHRVKNNLQIIASLLNLQRKYTNEPQLTSALIDGRNRVKSMALVHQLLYQNKNLMGINVRSYVDALVSSLFSSFKIDNDHVTFINLIEPIDIHEDSLLSIGLIINELVTNALKYAFLKRVGEIIISLKLVDDKIQLVVKDNGIGYDKNNQKSTNKFGYSLINSLAKKLGSEVDIEKNKGTIIKFMFTKFKLI